MHATPTPNPPVVISFSIISAERGAEILRSVYPNARITVDAHANAVIVVASGYDEQGMRTIASCIDVKNPTAVDTYQLKVLSPSTVASRLAGIFPSARGLAAPNRTVILMASPSEMAQAKQLITELDLPQMGTQYTQVYRLKNVDAQSVADLFRNAFRSVPISVDPDVNALTVTSNLTVQRRIADADSQLDVPPPGANGEGGGAAARGSMSFNSKPQSLDFRAGPPRAQGTSLLP